jgi:hypothetical protein
MMDDGDGTGAGHGTEFDARLRQAESAHESAAARDCRANNPARASREARATAEAARNLEFWRWAVGAEAVARAAGAVLRPWKALSGSVCLVGPDGREWPVARAGFADLLAVVRDPVAYAAHVADAEARVRSAPLSLSSLQAMLPGTLRAGFAAAAVAGHAVAGTLTETGSVSGLFVCRNGQYGPWYEATPAGVRHVYRAYLAGRLPMRKGHSPARVPELEARLSGAPDDAATVG